MTRLHLIQKLSQPSKPFPLLWSPPFPTTTSSQNTYRRPGLLFSHPFSSLLLQTKPLAAAALQRSPSQFPLCLPLEKRKDRSYGDHPKKNGSGSDATQTRTCQEYLPRETLQGCRRQTRCRLTQLDQRESLRNN